MHEEQGSNVLLFVYAMALSLLCTAGAYVGMQLSPEEVQSTEIIIFPHPENAS